MLRVNSSNVLVVPPFECAWLSFSDYMLDGSGCIYFEYKGKPINKRCLHSALFVSVLTSPGELAPWPCYTSCCHQACSIQLLLLPPPGLVDPL